jgi:hypothetical protein
MNQYYQEVNLPKVFVDTKSSEILYEIKRSKTNRPYVCLLTEFRDLLNPELLYAFKELGVDPYALITFGHERNINFKRDLYVHTDVIKKNNQWVKVPFAINWEVTDTSAEFKWYDTSGYEEFYPPNISTDAGYLLGNGIHYGRRYIPGTPYVSFPFTSIESYTFKPNSAVILNTSKPHSVIYEGLESRLNVSLRFRKISSWNDALRQFGVISHNEI